MGKVRFIAESLWLRAEKRLQRNKMPKWHVYRWDIINALLRKVNALKYLEIGVGVGHTFEKIVCPEKLGVDISNPRKLNNVIEIRSDEFFCGNTSTFDVVFVDGLHSYEQSLRDAVNALSCIGEGGLLVLHDCNPLHRSATVDFEKYTSGTWNGQVFNTANRLRLSEGIEMFTVDTDYGVAVARKARAFMLHSPYRELSYREFAEKREEYLNLKSVSWFFCWLDVSK